MISLCKNGYALNYFVPLFFFFKIKKTQKTIVALISLYIHNNSVYTVYCYLLGLFLSDYGNISGWSILLRRSWKEKKHKNQLVFRTIYHDVIIMDDVIEIFVTSISHHSRSKINVLIIAMADTTDFYLVEEGIKRNRDSIR